MIYALCSSEPADAPPVWRGGNILWGHFGKFAANPVGTIMEGYKANGPVFTMKFLNQPLTFLVGPDAHGPFYAGRDEELSQNEPYKFMTPIFGKGIVFDAPIDIKRQQLTFVSGALKPTALKTFVPQIIEEAENFFNLWPDSGECDLLEKMSELTILTASRCLLGKEVRENLFGEVSKLLHDIDEGINPIAIFFPYLPIPAFRYVQRCPCKESGPAEGRGGGSPCFTHGCSHGEFGQTHPPLSPRYTTARCCCLTLCSPCVSHAVPATGPVPSSLRSSPRSSRTGAGQG